MAGKSCSSSRPDAKQATMGTRVLRFLARLIIPFSVRPQLAVPSRHTLSQAIAWGCKERGRAMNTRSTRACGVLIGAALFAVAVTGGCGGGGGGGGGGGSTSTPPGTPAAVKTLVSRLNSPFNIVVDATSV